MPCSGLATLGIDVSIVSTGGVKTKNSEGAYSLVHSLYILFCLVFSDADNTMPTLFHIVNVMGPSVDTDEDNDVGFASAIGQFDSLIDTLANEQKGMVITDENPSGGSSVLQLLRSKHQCQKYISTLTQSQQIIKKEGVIFGPGKAGSHIKSMESTSPQQCVSLVPSLGFGPSTLKVLLENNILFSAKSTKPTAVRGWELKDFWEETSVSLFQNPTWRCWCK